MKRNSFLGVVGWLALGWAVLCACRSLPSVSGQSTVPGQQLLKQVGSLELPGPKGKRFDYLTIDPSRQWLFSTHLGAGLLYVVDLRTNKLNKTFEGLPGIEGVELVPDVNKAYTSNWQENKIGVIDLQQMKLIKKLPTESKPDGIAYAAPFHKIYVSGERGHAEAET
jgi:DNA-binding beta-propeller fold protein YncE